MFSFSFAWKFQGMPLIIYLMRKLKILVVILGLLLSYVTMGEDNSLYKENGKIDMIGGTYTARITASKAIVYADENMLSPLGYIANGKAIKVGNPRRINKDLVPLIVSGRLAFIEIKDIKYENSSDAEYKFKRGVPLEHNFDITLEKPEEKYTENNSLFFSLHTYSAGTDVNNAFLYFTEEDVTAMTGFNLQFFHRQPTSNFFWGLGLDYSGTSATGMSFNYLMATPTVGFTPVKNSFFALDIYGSLDLAVSNELKIENTTGESLSGFVWGPQLNVRALLYPYSKYHFFGGVGIRKYDVIGYEDLTDINGTAVEGINSIMGVGAFIGFGMDFR
jgi:hypothetical protein